MQKGKLLLQSGVTFEAPIANSSFSIPLDGSSAKFDGDGTRSNHGAQASRAHISLVVLTISDDTCDPDMPWTSASQAGLLSMNTRISRDITIALQVEIASGITASSAWQITC